MIVRAAKTLSVWKFLSWPGIFFVILNLSLAATARAEGRKFKISIHPNVSEEQCSKISDKFGFDEEKDFPKLLKKGWVALEKHSFEKTRKFYPCMQDVVAEFPTEQDFCEFLRDADRSPQYPFYSGADYGLQTSIFEHVAKTGDMVAYKILLSKDGRSDSELNAPLYAILRRNPECFLETFSLLKREQQEIVAKSQYDFNLKTNSQKIKIEGKIKASKVLTGAAKKFNSMLGKVAASY